MQARIGDHIIVRTHHLGEPEKTCEILEVHGKDGAPPYVVRWSGSGQEGLFFPGPDALLAGAAGPAGHGQA